MAKPQLVPLVRTEPQPLGGRADDELMALVQAGSRQAFAVLVERYALRVVQTCLRFAGELEQARELAQSTWVAVWEHRARYRQGGTFWLWLITVARNRCRNELRRRGTAQRQAQAHLCLGADASADQIDAVLQLERSKRVRDALSRLPTDMSEALLLRYSEDLRYDQMATVLGAKESTLRSRVHHGLKLLRRHLEKSR